MRWLDGKRVQLVGESPAISGALATHGAEVCESDCDILIHVAGTPSARTSHEMTHAEWRSVLDDGLDQRFLLAKDFAAARREAGKGGAVLFVGAPEQELGGAQAAAAGALGNLTKTLGVEWARDGIRVNTILTREGGATLGNFAAYLVSDYAAYVTGAVTGIGLGEP